MIDFHAWKGNSWAVLFSRPRLYTRLHDRIRCTCRLKTEFEKRNAKVLGLSVDPLDAHQRWSGDIQEVTGFAPNFPIIGDYRDAESPFSTI